MTQRIDLFGKISLGYAVIESRHLEDWRRFLGDGFGLHLAQDNGRQQAWRIDDHARRLVIERGPAEDVSALGWQVADQAALETLLGRLTEHHIEFKHIGGDLARERGVEAFWRVIGPKRTPLEFFVAPLIETGDLSMRTSAFVTGAGGLGHLAMTTRKPEATRRFWEEICDARYSDHIVQKIAGAVIDIDFFRLNERHHSVAIAGTRGLRLDPIRTRIQHLNLQVATIDDLTQAYVRTRELGFGMAHAMGQHPNDLELSFYAISPSGFEMELGWNPLVVDEATWTPSEYNGMSSWGHSLGTNPLVTNAGNLGRGLRSLLHAEPTPL